MCGRATAVTCSPRSARSWRFSARREWSPRSTRRSTRRAGCSARADMRRKPFLTDYVLGARERRCRREVAGGFLIPVTVDDLAANGLLEEAAVHRVCWERSVETLTARKDDLAGLAVASDERIEAYVLYTPADGGDCGAPLVCRGRRRPSEAAARATARARHGDLAVPEGPPGRDLEGVAAGARFQPRRRAPALRGTGAARLGTRLGMLRAIPSPARIVCAGSSLSGPAHVRANVGVPARLPPCEPGVPVRSSATDGPDVGTEPTARS